LAYLVARVQEEYGATAHHVVADRPYELTSVVGVGFASADRIARTGGATPDAGERAVPLDLAVPLLRVDTTDGYLPEFAAIVSFIRSATRSV